MTLSEVDLREIQARALNILKDAQARTSVAVMFADCLKQALSERGIPEDDAWDVKVKIDNLPKANHPHPAQKRGWHRVRNDATTPPPMPNFIAVEPTSDWKRRAANDD